MFKYVNNETLDIMYVSESDAAIPESLEYRLMTEAEIIKHESNPNTNYHVWDEDLLEWVDSRTPEQLAEYNRTQMPTLSPIEFDIKLNNAGLYDAVQELIKDKFELRITYNRATFFSRTDLFIEQARIALGLTDEQVDTIWVQQDQQPQP